MKKKNILLCVAGMTPQIITETLFALYERGETIDEIKVITTLSGRNRVMQSLLDEENGKFYEFCRDFGIDAKSINFNENTINLLDKPDGTTLDDIRTPEENAVAGDKICKIVERICRDENARLHVSAAGGRKTMSIYLAAAMQLFGRADDTLSHVLVSQDFETNPDFFYPPPIPKILTLRDGREVSTADAKIYLAPIPFIRLQGSRNALTLEEGQSYSDLVDQAQMFLDAQEKDYSLEIDLQENLLSVGGLRARISDYELLLFTLFAEKKLNGEGDGGDGFVYLRSLKRADFESAFYKIAMEKEGEGYSIKDEILIGTEWEFLLTIVRQTESDNPKDYEDFMNSVSRAMGRGNKKLREAGFPPKYEITSDEGSRPKKYGLSLDKELIRINGYYF